MSISSYINTDDTGARHKGVNSYCTHIGNEWFAWFETTARKNRINFLELLRGERTTLNQVLKRLYRRKAELLKVLDRPELPLHNNASEQDIREFVTKRKLSGSTRSESGRRCRDTFASLKKTCRQLGVSFWEYLKDRVSGKNLIPTLGGLIAQKALASQATLAENSSLSLA